MSKMLGGLIATLVVIFAFNLTLALPFPDNKYTNSVKQMGEWFLNNQSDSFIYYSYNTNEGKYDETGHPLREMASMWAIAKLGSFLNDPAFINLANKGFSYFDDFFKEDKENGLIYLDIEPKKTRLGYSAFAILTLIELEYPNKDEVLNKLADGILYLQKDSGEFDTPDNDYYPGEAMVALMSLYEYSNNPEYLEAVKKAFPFYRNYFRDNPNTAFVPWQSRALLKFYEATKDKEVADFVFEMNDYMLGQYTPQNGCKDFTFNRGSVAAVHAEGVSAAYELSKKTDDLERGYCYGNYVEEATDYILSLMITDEIKYPKPAIGGIMGGSMDPSLRADRNQHAIMMMMDAVTFWHS